MLVSELKNRIESTRARGAWNNGVKLYALDLIETLEDWNTEIIELAGLEKLLLNGAKNWNQYSEGGLSLIYNTDIAERLCNATELKRAAYGMKDPNPRENWIQCQARALYQAFNLIKSQF